MVKKKNKNKREIRKRTKRKDIVTVRGRCQVVKSAFLLGWPYSWRHFRNPCWVAAAWKSWNRFSACTLSLGLLPFTFLWSPSVLRCAVRLQINHQSSIINHENWWYSKKRLWGPSIYASESCPISFGAHFLCNVYQSAERKVVFFFLAFFIVCRTSFWHELFPSFSLLFLFKCILLICYGIYEIGDLGISKCVRAFSFDSKVEYQCEQIQKESVLKYNQSLLNGIRFDMKDENLRNQRYFDMKNEFEILD